MRLTEIREELLSQHAGIREIAEGVREVALRTSVDLSALRERVIQLVEAVDEHNQREEVLLADRISDIDAWGSVREARMSDHHRHEHRTLHEVAEAVAEIQDGQQASLAAIEMVERLLAHMREEEADLLNPNVMRDDVVTVGQSDG